MKENVYLLLTRPENFRSFASNEPRLGTTIGGGQRGWTTIESYGNGTEVDDPISKGQKDHPRCVVTMCRRGRA